MRRSVIAMLLVVVMLFTMHYAAAEDLDLSSMSTRELEKLRQRINVELKDRPPEREPEDETKRRDRIRSEFDVINNNYDFEAIISRIDSGESGLSDECAKEIRGYAIAAKTLIDQCNVDIDSFTGDLRITSPLLKAFADGCQVYPYIDRKDINIIVGFQYDEAFSYDSIYLKRGDDISKRERFGEKEGFDIQFETINGQTWEYSILESVFIGEHSLESIGFREEGSVRKIDYKLTENEKNAVDDLFNLRSLRRSISSRLSHWDYFGE